VATVCYSYRDQEAKEEARNRMVREGEERNRRGRGPKGQNDKRAPVRERKLAKA
jgi:hypothetical protein